MVTKEVEVVEDSDAAAAAAAAAASSPSLSSSSSEEDSDDDKGSDTKSTPNKSNDNRDDDDGDEGADDDVANGDNEEEEEESGEDSVLSEDDVKKLCIGVKEFIAGLQDEGKLGKKLKDDKSGLRLMTWPDLKKIAIDFYTIWNKSKHIPVGTNKSRGSDAILRCLLNMRKHLDATSVLPTLMQHVPNRNAEKVYIISNDDTGGQRALIIACQSHFSSKVVKQQGQRNANIAVRVAYCLCHSSLRAAAKYWLSNKRIRDDLNEPVRSEVAFGEKLLTLFRDPSLIIDRPEVMNLPDHDPRMIIDPTKGDFEKKSSKWILETWNEYIKPKYKKVLLKWFKNTGNGDRTLPNFINYCDISKETTGPTVWLVWIYAMDMKSDFLLASVSGKRPPGFILKEAGFTAADPNADVSFDAESGGFNQDSYSTPAQSTKKARLMAHDASLEVSRKKFDTIMTNLDKAISKKEENPVIKAYNDTMKLAQFESYVKEGEDNTPKTKEKLIAAIKEEKKIIAKNVIDHAANRNRSSDN